MSSLEGENDEVQLQLNDEMKIAPWKTRRVYIEAMQKKCILQLTGPSDSTGCGEGSSHVRISNKASSNKGHTPVRTKRIDKNDDSRRLSLLDAKNVVMQSSTSPEEIQKMSRRKMIDEVRKLCAEKVIANKQKITKYSRNRRYATIDSKREKFQEECQRIFDLQNHVVLSYELLSTDDKESLDEDTCSDTDKIGKNIENIFTDTETNTELSKEREEQERLVLRKMSGKHNNTKKKRRLLKFYRTYRESGGKVKTKAKSVSNPKVRYVCIKCKKNDEDSASYMQQNESTNQQTIRKQQSKYTKQTFEQEHSQSQPESKENNGIPFNVNPDMFTDHGHTEEDISVNFDGTLHTFSNNHSKQKRKNEFDCHNFKKLKKSTDHLRDGSITVLSSYFELILIELCNMPDVYPFVYPVDIQKIPDYYNIVLNPMDLETIMAKVHLRKYLNREQFLYDLNQIVENSTLYNGKKSSLTTVAHMMFRVCVKRMEENEKEIMYLEKTI